MVFGVLALRFPGAAGSDQWINSYATAPVVALRNDQLVPWSLLLPTYRSI
jgi:hypothetical protein